MKSEEYVEGLCKKLKPVLGVQAKELWYMYLSEDKKARRELCQYIEILTEKYLKPISLATQSILLEPPSLKDSNGEFLVGNAIYNNKILQPVYLRKADFIKQIGIFAVTGEGKTNLAFLFALNLLKEKIPFLVIDWKRSWRNLHSLSNVYPELQNAKLFTIGRDALPFLWNPFRAPPGSDKELWISTVAEALEKSGMSQQLLNLPTISAS